MMSMTSARTMPENTSRWEDRRQRTLGWSFSLLIHGLLAAVAIASGGRMPLHPPAEPFRWDVAVVQSSGGQPPITQRQAPTKHVSPARMPQASHSATTQSQSQTVSIATTPVQEAKQSVEQPVHRVVQQRIETVATNMAVRQESPQAMVSQAVMRETITPITQSEQGVARQLMQTHEGTQPHEGAPSLHGHAVARSIVSRAATVSFSQEVSKDSDYGWLTETLWKRVQTLKRYPSKAAADRIEGQVLVTAAVQANGAIAEVRVTESSGYPLLDEAAVEAVRNASPLPLLRPLDHAQVSVEIPITYHGHN